MYNKNKYLMDKIGGILSIVLGGFMVLGGIITLVSAMKTCSTISKLDIEMSDEMASELFFAVFVGLGVKGAVAYLFIKFGLATISEPFLFKDTKGNAIWCYAPKGKNLTLIIVSGLLFFFGVFLSGGETVEAGGLGFKVVTGVQWIQNLLCLAIMVLKIIALCLKDNPTQQTTQTVSKQNFSATQQQVPQSDSIENKIKELKRLKELCVITEEQYQKAVAELVKNASK